MVGKRCRAFSILGLVAWFAASCTTTPEEESPGPPAGTAESIYLEISDADRRAADAALQDALETLPSGQSLAWDGPDGVAGLIAPLRTFKIKTGHFCRDFTEALIREAVPLTVASRACRTTEGRWLRVPIARP